MSKAYWLIVIMLIVLYYSKEKLIINKNGKYDVDIIVPRTGGDMASAG